MIHHQVLRKFGIKHSKYAIVGGGLAGIGIAGRLAANKNFMRHDITIFENSNFVYYKPGWTLVASGLMDIDKVRQPIAQTMPKGVGLKKNLVIQVEPDQNKLHLDNGDTHTYDTLILATGIKFDWQKIKGLREALEDDNRPVCSIYYYPKLEKILKLRDRPIKNAIFTQAPDPITCGGAPQKIMYTTCDYWRKNHKYPEHIDFFKDGGAIFGVKFYAQALQEIANNYKANCNFWYVLEEIKSDKNVAVFRNTKDGSMIEREFDFLHVTPPMSGREYLKGSGLENQSNFFELDQYTLRSTHYPNVWGLGDGSNLPTSKTMSAVLDEIGVLEQNLTDVYVNNGEPTAKYDGYTGCPVLVGGGRVLLAEFKYNSVIAPTFMKDQRNPLKFNYFLKSQVFPFLVNKVLKYGKVFGRNVLWDNRPYDYSEFQKKEEEKWDLKLKERQEKAELQKPNHKHHHSSHHAHAQSDPKSQANQSHSHQKDHSHDKKHH